MEGTSTHTQPEPDNHVGSPDGSPTQTGGLSSADPVLGERSEWIPEEEIATLFPLSVPQPEGSFDPEKEKQRQTVTEVKEIGVRNIRMRRAFATVYLDQLNLPSNRPHFTDIPTSVKDMENRLRQKNAHGLAVYNALGEVVGFAVIRDPETDQNDSWLEKMVIVENLQSKEKDQKDSAHVGTQALDRIVEWAFSTPTHDKRERTNLHAAVVMFVKDWERMDHLLTGHGFEARMRLHHQAIVTLEDGTKETKDVQRFELSRRAWESRQALQTEMERDVPNIIT